LIGTLAVQPREDPIAQRRCDPRARAIVLAIYDIERDLAPASNQLDSERVFMA